MKVKSWTRYFIYICLILVLMFWGQQVYGVIRQNIQVTFKLKPYYMNVMIIFYFVVGLLLGLEHLIREIKKEGTWTINLPKILIMGLPSLYFSLAVFTFYNGIQFMWNIFSHLMNFLIVNGTNFISVFQLILGYSIITSFYKTNKSTDNGINNVL